MKISVLIPTYNYNCTGLIQEMAQQLDKLRKHYAERITLAELVVVDDGSNQLDVKEQNRQTCEETGARFVALTHNVGRSTVRNRLAQEAQGDWLLFMDNDSVVEDKNYLQKYVEEVCNTSNQNDGTQKPTVLCGTLVHPDTLPSPNQSLRFRYEKAAEQKNTANKMNKQPYAHFRTSHFMVPREVMLAHPFDESIKQYGYEDVLLGKALKQSGVRVLHCDIAVLNGDIETNEVFLRKTEEQMHTLHQLQDELQGYSSLLDIYMRAKKWHMLGIIRFLFRMLKSPIRHNLLGSKPNLTLFQFYKLGFFCGIKS